MFKKPFKPFINLAMTSFMSSLALSLPLLAKANEQVIKIYMDADRTNHYQSALSMEMGIKTAFSEINNTIQGYTIEFIPKDHKGNTIRSNLHMKQFKKDDQALFILAGLHSPPLIKYRDYINTNKILTLVPWAAAGPITRPSGDDNWIFRLSIDDSKAGYRIADYAVNKKHCKRPHLLLEKTPWGESNYKTMSSAIKDYLKTTPEYTWFNWNTKYSVAKIMLRKIIQEQQADCILFVGNAIEGIEFSKAMLDLKQQVPLISHWGITGGDFHEKINNQMRKNLDLSFIQTCFSFVSSPANNISKKAFANAQKLYPNIKHAKDIPAPTGFIHAYDLGLLVIYALQQIELGDNMEKNRDNLRKALENIKSPVTGLIKQYKSPFKTWSQEQPDAHEALNLEDFCMGYYGNENEVIVDKN